MRFRCMLRGESSRVRFLSQGCRNQLRGNRMGKQVRNVGTEASESASQLSLDSLVPISEETLLKTAKTLRIAVTGDVFVTELERRIIDTPDFQRLRGVRQLGNVLHVYPTALHTRFDHSLGTLMMTDKMITAIRKNAVSGDSDGLISPMQEILARLYALLHDVTHVPFGHTIEDELQLLPRHDNNPDRILKFLGEGSAIGSIIVKAIGSDNYARFMRIYLWEDDQEKQVRRSADPAWKELKQMLVANETDDDVFIHDLVSNTVCADLLDYVMRDSFFCNLGISLEYRFISFLYLGRPNGSKYRRTFVRLWKGRHHIPRRDTMTDLARLLEARYMIAERAYFHHAKIISGAMIGRALQEHITGGLLKEADLYRHTDETLIHALCDSGKSEVASKLAVGVRDRVLHKAIGEPYLRSSFDAVGHGDVEHDPKETVVTKLGNKDSRRAIENELAAKIGAEQGDVLIYAPTLDMNPKAAEMNVRWAGKDMKFREIDDPVMRPRLEQIIHSHHMLWGVHLLATREIVKDVERSALLKEAFEVDFLCAEHDRKNRKHEHLKRVLHFTLRNEHPDFNLQDLTYHQLDEKMDQGVDALEVTARGAGDIRKQINEVINRFILN